LTSAPAAQRLGPPVMMTDRYTGGGSNGQDDEPVIGRIWGKPHRRRGFVAGHRVAARLLIAVMAALFLSCTDQSV
jgi:hypothetical protein